MATARALQRFLNIELNEASCTKLLNKGIDANARADFDDAEKCFEQVINYLLTPPLKPNSTVQFKDACYYRAINLFAIGTRMYDKATCFFDLSLKFSEKQEDFEKAGFAKYYLGCIEKSKGHFSQAVNNYNSSISFLRKVVQENKDSSNDSKIMIGRAYLQVGLCCIPGSNAKAEIAFSAAKKSFSESGNLESKYYHLTLLEMGKLYSHNKKYPEVQAEITKAYEYFDANDKSDNRAYFTECAQLLGFSLYKQEKFQDAAAKLKDALPYCKDGYDYLSCGFAIAFCEAYNNDIDQANRRVMNISETLMVNPITDDTQADIAFIYRYLTDIQTQAPNGFLENTKNQIAELALQKNNSHSAKFKL